LIAARFEHTFPTKMLRKQQQDGGRYRIRAAAHHVHLALVLLTAVLLVPAFCTADEADTDAALKPVDLSQAGFDIALQALPAGRGVLMEFYATWCPACQHFQPHYEKVALPFFSRMASA